MYLGNEITTAMDGLCKDTKIKRAKYIERNIELIQEFQSADPEVRCNIKKIYVRIHLLIDIYATLCNPLEGLKD